MLTTHVTPATIHIYIYIIYIYLYIYYIYKNLYTLSTIDTVKVQRSAMCIHTYITLLQLQLVD